MTAPDSWMRKVQALLAKAESTEFPEEAEALLVKAQALMSRHAIDEAMLAAGRVDPHDVSTRSILVPGPYAGARSSLLDAVASANRCRCIVRASGGGQVICAVVGHPGDLDRAETLFASLSMHSVTTMLAATVPPYDTPRRFRHAFVLAFAARIGERLEAAAAAAEAQARQTSGPGGSVALVLADRRQAVDEAVRTGFPHLRRITTRASSTAGAAHGRRAADSAALGATLRGSRRGLQQ